jgi:hypothetical protein
MLKAKVHIHKLLVTQIAETITFRIPLPNNLERITGILVTENTILPTLSGLVPRFKSDHVYDTFPVGEMGLRDRGYSDWFFNTTVMRSDKTIVFGDFAELDFYNRQFPVTWGDFHRHEWFKAGTKHEEWMIDLVPSSGYLSGYYRDRFNEFTGVVSRYEITIYLFYDRETKQETCEQN